MRRTAAALLAAVLTIGARQGEPAFDAVSIKPNTSGSLQRNFNAAEGGHFVAVNVALGDLIRVSHGVRPAGQAYSNLTSSGLPWLYTDTFDIRATTAAEPTRELLLAMLRAMLRERFHLRVHSISQEETVFQLRCLRDDCPLGPGLKPSSQVCAGPTPQCSLTNLPGKISATAVPMDAVVHMLSGWTDGHIEVRDRTGLTGQFSVDLTWTPTQGNTPLPDGIIAPAIDPDGAPLVTALRDQLGLRLVRTSVDVPVLVVDAADKPAAD